MVLERDNEGIGNWKFGPGAEPRAPGGFALIPKNRTQFPTLLDLVLKDGLITYRTYSGNILRITLDNVAIPSAGEDTPVSLKAAGAYNNTALILDATTQSFSRPARCQDALRHNLHHRWQDRKTVLRRHDDGAAGFRGCRRCLVDRCRAAGKSRRVPGAEIAANYPLLVDAHLTRKGDHWELQKAKGTLPTTLHRPAAAGRRQQGRAGSGGDRSFLRPAQSQSVDRRGSGRETLRADAGGVAGS